MGDKSDVKVAVAVAVAGQLKSGIYAVAKYRILDDMTLSNAAWYKVVSMDVCLPRLMKKEKRVCRRIEPRSRDRDKLYYKPDFQGKRF